MTNQTDPTDKGITKGSEAQPPNLLDERWIYTSLTSLRRKPIVSAALSVLSRVSTPGMKDLNREATSSELRKSSEQLSGAVVRPRVADQQTRLVAVDELMPGHGGGLKQPPA